MIENKSFYIIGTAIILFVLLIMIFKKKGLKATAGVCLLMVISLISVGNNLLPLFTSPLESDLYTYTASLVPLGNITSVEKHITFMGDNTMVSTIKKLFTFSFISWFAVSAVFGACFRLLQKSRILPYICGFGVPSVILCLKIVASRLHVIKWDMLFDTAEFIIIAAGSALGVLATTVIKNTLEKRRCGNNICEDKN